MANNFKRSQKVVCTNNQGFESRVTVGKAYKVASVVGENYIKITNDGGWCDKYPANRFEAYNDMPVQSCPFKVGDEVYRAFLSKIYTITAINEFGYAALSGLNGWHDTKSMCLATIENYNALSILFERMEIERPLTPLSKITIALLKNNDGQVCFVGDELDHIIAGDNFRKAAVITRFENGLFYDENGACYKTALPLTQQGKIIKSL